MPAAGEPSNVGRNFFTGPSFFNLDMTVGKKFRFSESQDLEIRVEAQNITNTPSFAVPDANLILTTASLGQVLGTTTSTSRRVQFVAKFNFYPRAHLPKAKAGSTKSVEPAFFMPEGTSLELDLQRELDHARGLTRLYDRLGGRRRDTRAA